MKRKSRNTLAVRTGVALVMLAYAGWAAAQEHMPPTGKDIDEKMQVEPERANFRALKLANPNYFGTLKDHPLKAVKVLKYKTKYEEIKCVGFNPDSEMLEAVVYVNKTYGYSGDICTDGSLEYVRFYLSYDDGVTWKDQGMVSFAVYDVPGPKPLEYAATLWIDPKNKPCKIENLPKVRAILSWNDPPTPNTPDFIPPWGNVKDANIQIDGWKGKVAMIDFVKELDIELPDKYKGMFDLKADVPLLEPVPLGLGELHALYAKTEVPPHRYMHKEITEAITLPPAGALMMLPPGVGDFPPDICPPEPPIPIEWPFDLPDLPGIDWPVVIDDYTATVGDTKYEELGCIGLDPAMEALVGVLQVKLPYGYCGDLCDPGSTEYVGFWIDWGVGGGWEPAGVATVNTHDIKNIPPEGLMYSVNLPVNLSAHYQECKKGPKIAKVRAVLSWNTPPMGPFYKQKWGNSMETLVHVPPWRLEGIDPTGHAAIIESVAGVAPCAIEQSGILGSQGRTIMNKRPFGRTLKIAGFILNPPDRASLDPFRYRVSVRDVDAGGPWEPLANSFNIWTYEQIGTGPIAASKVKQDIQSDGFYIYREDPSGTGTGWRRVSGNVLAYWSTTNAQTGLWEIMLEAKQGFSGTPYPAAETTCAADGTKRQTVLVYLDQALPVPEIKITGYSTTESGPVTPAEDCGTFKVAHFIHGKYSASDDHFWSLKFSVMPSAPAHGATVDPALRTYPTVSTLGESGTWILDTEGMDACGFNILMEVWDRTIVDGAYRWYDRESVGFCLVEK